MICPTCKTEPELRKIPFGRAGKIEIRCCECFATKLALKYSNTGKADNHEDIFQEGL